MTEKYDPYENAVAEKINGVLKQEFYIDIKDISVEQRKKLVDNSILIYNQIRPHWSSNLLTPNQIHRQNKQKIKTYKKRKKGSNINITTSS